MRFAEKEDGWESDDITTPADSWHVFVSGDGTVQLSIKGEDGEFTDFDELQFTEGAYIVELPACTYRLKVSGGEATTIEIRR